MMAHSVKRAEADVSALDDRSLEKLEQLGQRVGHDGFLSQVAKVCLEHIPPVDWFQQAITAGDAQAVTEMAHTLAGNSATLGAERLAKLCKEMEGYARAGTTTACRGLWGDFSREYEKFEIELRMLASVF